MTIVKLLKKGMIYLSSLILVFLFTKGQTDGFSESNIYTLKNQGPRNTNHIPALNQRYVYLSHGAQSFALASEDGQFVIKFFRKDRATHPLSPISFLFPSFFKTRLKQTLDKREARRVKTFKSFRIAYKNLQEATGLLEARLTTDETVDQTLIFTDKIGVIHNFSLAGVPFLLQKKADPLYSKLQQWIQEGKEELIKSSLSELLKLLKSRCEKGIFDKDPDLATNFGWIDNHPIQIDVGRFTFDETRKNPIHYRDEIFRITNPLCTWLDSHGPDLAENLRKEIKAL